jgi:nuclear pore complex protein Nup93
MQDSSLDRYFDSVVGYVDNKRGRKDANGIQLVRRIRELLGNYESIEDISIIWEMLEKQVEEFNPEKTNQAETFRNYAQSNSELMGQIVKRSWAYLENTFNGILRSESKSKSYEELIEEYCHRSFGLNYNTLSSKFPGVTILDNKPIYAIVYYLIRAGQYNDALNFSKTIIDDSATIIASLIEEYSQNNYSISEDSLAQGIDLLKRGIKDPYKEAILLILTRNFKDPNESLLLDMEDYMWFYLKIVHTDNLDSEDNPDKNQSYATISLANFQNNILNFGPANFNPTNATPLNYVKTLFLVGLYNHVMFSLHFDRQ